MFFRGPHMFIMLVWAIHLIVQSGNSHLIMAIHWSAKTQIFRN